MPVPASRSIAPVREAARPMPWVEELRGMYETGVTFRNGQLIMLAGYPASGKSLFAQWLCDKWAVPTMYVSMDMSQVDTISRLASIRTGMVTADIRHAFESDGPEAAWIEEQLSESVMDFVYDDAPTLMDILKEVAAYVEMYGSYPSVLVLDNLLDIDHESDDDYRAWNATLLWLKSLVRQTGMTIIVIHHARELEKTDYPPPRKDLAGKVARTPELVLCVSMTDNDEFRVAATKNRGGKQSGMAKEGHAFKAIPGRVQFRPLGAWVKPDGKSAA